MSKYVKKNVVLYSKYLIKKNYFVANIYIYIFLEIIILT